MGENGEIKLVPAKRQITIHDLLSFAGGLSATYLAGLGPVQKYVAEKYAEADVQDLMNETYTNRSKRDLVLSTGGGFLQNPGCLE